MDALLARVLEGQGGIDRWRTLSTLTGTIAYDGPFWEFKGHPDFVGSDTVQANLQEQQIHQIQRSTGRTVVFDARADRVTVTGPDGRIVEELDSPRATFAGYAVDTPWTLAQTAYFRSYATWHYLVEPYVFAWPGVEAHEVEPWTEDGRTWRVLSVTFPDSIHVHNPTQLYYFDDAGRLRRMDYQPAVTGDSPVAHYVRDEQTFDGIVVPTERHIFLRNEDRTPDLSWTPITLSLGDVRFSG
jgi:hypothetical protein